MVRPFLQSLITTRLVAAGAAPATTTSHGYVYDLFRRFHASDFVAGTAQFLLVKPLRIVLILVASWVFGRLGARACRRAARSLRLRAPMLGASPRADSRAATVGGALGSVVRIFVWTIGVLTALGELGIKLAPFVAGATVIGAALGFGAQSLVRDFLSGLLILVEDQFGVGDTVTLGEVTGTVEAVNLRTTRLRSFDGVVWYVPNGEIRKVGNKSDTFSRAVVDIAVPPAADVVQTVAILQDETAAVAAEDEWVSVLLEPPAVLGVIRTDQTAMVVRVTAKLAVGQSDGFGRALRARLHARLSREGLAWPDPVAAASTPDSTPEPGD